MYKDIAWLPLCLALSILFGAGAYLTFRRGRPMAAARWAGAALLPIGLYLIGAVRLVWDIGYELTRFVARFALSPTVWLGMFLLALSAGLFATTTVLSRRGLGGGDEGGGDRLEGARDGGARAVPAAGGGRRGRLGRGGKLAGSAKLGGDPVKRPSSPAGGGDFDDIEDILRRRGIK